MQLLNNNEKINDLGLYQGQGKSGKRFLSLATAFVITLSMLPLFYLIVRAIQRPFEQTADLVLRDKTLEVVATTALLVVLVVLLTGIFGLAIASGLHFVELPLKPLLIIPVFLPLAIPSYGHLSGGLLLAGLYSMSDFGAVSLLNVDTLTVTIQNMYRASYDRTAAAVMSLVLIFLSALFVIGDEKIRQKNMKTKVINTLSIIVSFSSRFDLIYQTTFLLAFAYALLFLAKSVATMSSSLAQVPAGAKEVAATLGLSRWAVLKNVIAPISSPGIALGTTLVFLTAMKELPATLMLRPTGFETLATQIWSYAAINRFNEAAPYALILIAIAAIPTFILSRPDKADRIQLSQGFGS